MKTVVFTALLLTGVHAHACPPKLVGKFSCGTPAHTVRTIKKTGDLTYNHFVKFDDGVTFQQDYIVDGQVRKKMDHTSRVSYASYCPAGSDSLVTRQVYLTRYERGVTNLTIQVTPTGLLLTGTIVVTQDGVETGHSDIYEECTRI